MFIFIGIKSHWPIGSPLAENTVWLRSTTLVIRSEPESTSLGITLATS